MEIVYIVAQKALHLGKSIKNTLQEGRGRNIVKLTHLIGHQ